MSFKYDVVHFVGKGPTCGDVPVKLHGKTFTSFSKVVAAICAAIKVGESCTVRKMEVTGGSFGVGCMGFREVTPEENDSYSYQRGWAPEY